MQYFYIVLSNDYGIPIRIRPDKGNYREAGAPPLAETPALSRNCELMYNAECIIYNEFNYTFLILNHTLYKPGDLP